MTTASRAHWDCQINHPPQQGYRSGRMHRRGCNVAESHEAGTTALECRKCRSIYNPTPRSTTRVHADQRHYACTLARWEHAPPLRKYARAGHQAGCPTKTNHYGEAGHSCWGCRAIYSGRNDGIAPTGLHNSHPHWNCQLAPEEHAALSGRGFGHRPNCAVAQGHALNTTIKGCPECRKANYKASARPKVLKKKYGLTPEDFDQLLIAQGGKCAICHEPTRDGKSLRVDHSHVTNENRGLLCGSCNLGLGYFHDREDVLLSAVEYLRRVRT